MKKLLLSISFALFAIMQIWAQSVSISESKGWLESAYIKWLPLEEATSYNVYYKTAAGSDSDYKKIDGMLIRKYADYFRADAVGLKAGNYVLKVVPIFNDEEDISKEAVSSTLDVKSYTREGFAFSQNSPFKTGSGAYNDDGTLRSSAKVVYLTAATADTMKLNVVVDAKGKEETRVGIVDILAGKQKGFDKTPLAIRIIGEVKASNITGLNSSGYIQIKGKSAYSELNITLEGIGDDATTNGWSALVRSAGNIEIRNLGIMNFEDDGISLDTENVNIWVHNNDFFYGKQGSGDKAKGDGSFDLKGDSKYITASYNHFWDSGKASLCGMTGESGPNYITYHHNWFDHSDSRHPRVRTMTVHVYNNYFDGNSKYGVGATTGSSVFVENNYFRNCKSPMLISKQGTDVFYDSKGTFSGEEGGMIKSFGNIILDARRFVDQNTSATDFDAITVTSRNETVPSTYSTLLGGHTYNNFDTDANIIYAYTPHSAEDAKNDVIQYAGRVNGGDLQWTFDNSVDDNSYDINAGLRAAVNNYSGTVLAIGSGNTEEIENPENPEGPEEPKPEGDMIHNFTENGKTNNFFTITGNLSTSKGSVTYNGQALTQCLKMESSTNITFTTTKESKLILVFNADFNGRVKINGENYNAVSGILEIDLPAGTHTITKNDTTNLFYISLEYKETTGIETTDKVDFSVYPNPVTDRLYISSETEVMSVEVYSISGTLVLQQKGNVESIDMNNLIKGSYIVNVNTTAGVHRQVIIKK